MKKSTPCTRWLASGLLLAGLGGTAVTVADTHWRDNNFSYDQARRALARGEILSLGQIIQHLRKYSNGRIVSTEYEYEFDRWVYEFKVIDSQGRMSKIHIDAKLGNLVREADD